MFRKIVGFALLAVVMASPVFAGEPGDRLSPDAWGVGGPGSSRVSSQPVVRVDYDGDVLPAENARQSVGSPTETWKSGHFGSIEVTSGIANHTEFFFNLSSGNTLGMRAAGFVVSTNTLRNSATTYIEHEIIQSSGAPRNVTISVSSSVIGAIGAASTMTLIGCATFYGYDAAGYFVSELVSFSTTSGVSIVLSTAPGAGLCQDQTCQKSGMGVGNVAFAKISSFTAQLAEALPVAGSLPELITLRIGWGNKIGLSNQVSNSSDVYKVTDSNGDVSSPQNNPGFSVNTTFSTVVFDQTPALSNKKVWYKTRRSWR